MREVDISLLEACKRGDLEMVTASVDAGSDVDFILQHHLYVVDRYDQLRNIHAASHAELVDYRNRWCSSDDGKIESFLV